jgi:hypothetical protein
MIAKVVNVLEKQGTKGVYSNVQLEVEGKKIALNSFDLADNTTFRQAKESGQFVVVETTKNDKGYDQTTKVSLMADNLPKDTPPPPSDTTKVVKENFAKKPEDRVGEFNNDDIRNRCICMSYAKDLVIPLALNKKQMLEYAEAMYQWVISGKVTVEKEF